MKNIHLILFALIYPVAANAQSVLEQYISEGMQNNEGVRQQSFILQSGVHALKEARSLFFPTLAVSGSYSRADGGRTIDLPLGDLLNPVYSSLNDLTGSHKFPMMENQDYLFAADNFYDAKLRFALPVFDAELFYNLKIKSNAVSLQETEINLFKRELVKEIKIAYYQYCQAAKNREVAANNLALTQENCRVNKAMYENDKANYFTLLRS
jgi:outer membrane protein TolC